MKHHHPAKPSMKAARRGMLLLVVLLMLSMFLGIGAILLTLAARARAAARASAAMNASASFGDSLARDALDQALMAVLRGAASGTDGSVTLSGPFRESLLADKYGPATTGTCTGITGTNTSLMTINVAGLAPAMPTNSVELNGRILTLLPNPQNGDVSSFRILGTLLGQSAVYAARLPGTSQPVFPSGQFPVVINGRDFTPAPNSSVDAYDAYDLNNEFLAQPQISGGAFNGSFAKLSFAHGSTSAAAQVDNDNDGVNDGIWLSGTVVPSLPSPLGGSISFDVSYLIVDLDGRLNVNAVGTGTTFTAASFTGAPTGVPTGMGYGPADVNPSNVLPPTSPPATLPMASSSMSSMLIIGGTPTTSLTAPTANQRRMPPRLGRVDGRYGSTSGISTPGRPGDDTEAAQRTTIAEYTAGIGGNSQADLRSRFKVFMAAAASPAPGVLTFQASTSASGNDWTDDPYEIRLDADGPRFGTPRRPAPASGSSEDNLFTFAELERLLRPNDVDAPALPPRLAAILGDSAQQLRMHVTTDSWDTPALTGSTANVIAANLLSGTSTAANRINRITYPWNTGNAASPDVAAGLRFNVNRPVAAGIANDAAQQAYCRGLYTLIAALRPGFDRQRAAQWAVNALDFRDIDSRMTRFRYATDLTAGWPASPSLEVWGAERPDLVISAVTNNGTGITSVQLVNPYLVRVGTGTTELVDSSLIATGQPNTVDFKKTVGAGSDSIWRLRTTATGTANGKDLTSNPFTPQSAQTVTLTTPLLIGGATTVVLERLADPSQPFNATTNPYRPVDEEPVSLGSATQPWTHWPNRHFVSPAELLLVTSGSVATSTPGAGPTQSVAIDIPELLDATHVPTLFAGHAVTANATQVLPVGLDQISTNNLSLWREPGRINVNTIPDTFVWSALVGTDTPASNPLPLPITSMGQLLAPPSALASRTFGDARDLNQFFARSLAIRLANTATVRSNVFAIWITVRITDSSTGGPSPITKRMFAIVDRSIPVGYLPGRNLNVRDMIRLRTFID
jgi:hypothetical protein